jgi:acetyl-CoA carboxylase carboxyltransferase component
VGAGGRNRSGDQAHRVWIGVRTAALRVVGGEGLAATVYRTRQQREEKEDDDAAERQAQMRCRYTG